MCRCTHLFAGQEYAAAHECLLRVPLLRVKQGTSSRCVPQGGDLMRAINNDRANELRWSRKGGLLMLDIARGLTFLHANKVRSPLLCLPTCKCSISMNVHLMDVGLNQVLTGDS